MGEPRTVVHELTRVEIREFLDCRLVRLPRELSQGLALGKGTLDEMRVPSTRRRGVEVLRGRLPGFRELHDVAKRKFHTPCRRGVEGRQVVQAVKVAPARPHPCL